MASPLGLYEPRCIVFSDIRGDFRLLLTLLSQILRVAEFRKDDQRWHWTCSNTVLICLGNFLDRFEPRGMNRLTISTQKAIEDESRILETFIQLEAPNDQGNALVVLSGDHELGNLLGLDGYEYYQMAQPQEDVDRRLRKDFVEQYVWPFVQRHGILAGWGCPGGTVYASHGSLTRKWFQRHQIKSLQDLNRKWRHWMETKNKSQLMKFVEPDSPIMSSEMALKPQVWREFDEEFIVQLLGEDPNPRFVQSTMIPVQRMHFYSYDTRLVTPSFDAKPMGTPTILASRNVDAIDQIYLLNNCMADTFCMYDDADRQPQGLEFSLKINNMGEALFFKVKALVMRYDEYQIYLKELPYGSCAPSAEYSRTSKTTALSPEEMVAIRPALSEGTMDVINQGSAHIENVGIVILSHDMKHMFLIEDLRGKWTIPRGPRKPDENDWDAMIRVLKESANLSGVDFLRGGSITDFEGSSRIWLKRTHRSLHTDGKVGAKWVALDDILTTDLNRKTKIMLCVFARNQLLPPLRGFQYECPSWLKEDDPDLRQRVLPWWKLDQSK